MILPASAVLSGAIEDPEGDLWPKARRDPHSQAAAPREPLP